MNLASAPSSPLPAPSAAPLRLAARGTGLFGTAAGFSIPLARGLPRRRPRFTLFPLSFLCTTSLLTETPPWGFFIGQPKIELLHGGRKLRLLEDFSYTDPHGRTWLAPAASVIDELSLPFCFWLHVGRPFAAPFLSASIIHDVACEQRLVSWSDAHLVFYHALRSGGAGETAAKVLYYAAHHFGPRWGSVTACAEVLSALGLGDENRRQAVSAETATDVYLWIEAANPSLEILRATKPPVAKATATEKYAPAC